MRFLRNRHALKDKIRVALLVLFAIIFVWLIAEGDLLESLSTEGWNGRSISDSSSGSSLYPLDNGTIGRRVASSPILLGRNLLAARSH